MKILPAICRSTLALGLSCALPAIAHAAVLYNEIVVKDAGGTALASVTATPDELTDPNAIFFLPGIAVDPTEYGNYGIVMESGNPVEVFGIFFGLSLGFGLQNVAAAAPLQNPVDGTGDPIDLTQFLDPSLRAAGDTAAFIVSAPATAVPEPLSWAMMVAGFASIGYGLRRKVRRTSLAYG